MPAIGVPTIVRGVDPAVVLTLPPAARIRCTMLDGSDALRFALTNGTPAGCIVAAQLDPGLRRQLDRILLDVPDAHLVVGLETEGLPGGAARPTSTRVTIVSPLPDPARMAQALCMTWFEGRRAELLRSLDEAPLHWLMKQAVRVVFAQDLASGTPPVHSIEALATCCGTDRAGLWRARRGADLDLARLIFLWVVVLALRERFLPTSPPRARASRSRGGAGIPEPPASRRSSSVNSATACGT